MDLAWLHKTVKSIPDGLGQRSLLSDMADMAQNQPGSEPGSHESVWDNLDLYPHLLVPFANRMSVSSPRSASD